MMTDKAGRDQPATADGCGDTSRPAYYANRVLRLAIKATLAQEVGPDGLALLTVIAMTEDARRYRGPVTFWTSQLLPLVGFAKWDRLDAARRKLIEVGWLLYEPGDRHRPGRYRVRIPQGLEAVADSAVDEGSIPVSGALAADEDESSQLVDPRSGPPKKGSSRGTSGGAGRGSRRGTSIPEPTPEPKPVSEKNVAAVAAGVPATAVAFPDALDRPDAKAAFGEWQEHRKQLRKPLKPLAHQKLLEQWADKGADRFVAAVNHSIANGWQGLFEPNNGNRSQGSPQSELMGSLNRFMEAGGDE